jgi:hypothetical protein
MNEATPPYSTNLHFFQSATLNLHLRKSAILISDFRNFSKIKNLQQESNEKTLRMFNKVYPFFLVRYVLFIAPVHRMMQRSFFSPTSLTVMTSGFMVKQGENDGGDGGMDEDGSMTAT